jgi:hypothetical protein
MDADRVWPRIGVNQPAVPTANDCEAKASLISRKWIGCFGQQLGIVLTAQ